MSIKKLGLILLAVTVSSVTSFANEKECIRKVNLEIQSNGLGKSLDQPSVNVTPLARDLKAYAEKLKNLSSSAANEQYYHGEGSAAEDTASDRAAQKLMASFGHTSSVDHLIDDGVYYDHVDLFGSASAPSLTLYKKNGLLVAYTVGAGKNVTLVEFDRPSCAVKKAYTLGSTFAEASPTACVKSTTIASTALCKRFASSFPANPPVRENPYLDEMDSQQNAK